MDQHRSFQGVVVSSSFLRSVIAFDFLSYLFIRVELFDDFFVHFWFVAVPPISFNLPRTSHFFQQIVRRYMRVGKLGSYFSWSFRTLFFFMPHSSTILTRSLSKRRSLVPLLSSVVPLLDGPFGFVGGYFDEVSSTFGVLGVPGELLDVVGSVLLSLHLLYIIWGSKIGVKEGIVYICK